MATWQPGDLSRRVLARAAARLSICLSVCSAVASAGPVSVGRTVRWAVLLAGNQWQANAHRAGFPSTEQRATDGPPGPCCMPSCIVLPAAPPALIRQRLPNLPPATQGRSPSSTMLTSAWYLLYIHTLHPLYTHTHHTSLLIAPPAMPRLFTLLSHTRPDPAARSCRLHTRAMRSSPAMDQYHCQDHNRRFTLH
jgi:hypothetical protein